MPRLFISTKTSLWIPWRRLDRDTSGRFERTGCGHRPDGLGPQLRGALGLQPEATPSPSPHLALSAWVPSGLCSRHGRICGRGRPRLSWRLTTGDGSRWNPTVPAQATARTPHTDILHPATSALRPPPPSLLTRAAHAGPRWPRLRQHTPGPTVCSPTVEHRQHVVSAFRPLRVHSTVLPVPSSVTL